MTSNAVQNSPFNTAVSKVYNTTSKLFTDATIVGTTGGNEFTLSQALYEVLQTGPVVTCHYTLIWTSTGSAAGLIEINFPKAPGPGSTALGGPICHYDHTASTAYAGIVVNQLFDNSGVLQIRPNWINATTGVISARVTAADSSASGIACGTITYGTEHE